MRKTARQLIAWETRANKSSATAAPGALPVSDRLRPHLTTLMGQGGYRALLMRSLVLAQVEFPVLNTIQLNAHCSLEGPGELPAPLDPKDLAEGKVEIFAQMLGLLVAFIGPNLTWRLIGDAWPQMLLPVREFEYGETHEKNK